MVEILMAVMVLAVGLIMLFPAFSVGLAQSRQSTESMLMSQLGPNAEAYIRAMINPRTDPNFSTPSNAIRVYTFVTTPGGTPAGALPGFTWWRHKANGSIATTPPTNESNYERINPRIYGDPYTSKYYWNLLYRYKSSDPRVIEFWILVCKRLDTDQDSLNKNPPASIAIPTTVPGVMNLGWATSGVRTGSVSPVSSAAYLDPGSAVVTVSLTATVQNDGEILQIVSKQGPTVTFDRPLLRASPAVTNLWMCRFQAADGTLATEGNACIGAFYFRLSN